MSNPKDSTQEHVKNRFHHSENVAAKDGQGCRDAMIIWPRA